LNNVKIKKLKNVIIEKCKNAKINKKKVWKFQIFFLYLQHKIRMNLLTKNLERYE